jgi:hypothetical protein
LWLAACPAITCVVRAAPPLAFLPCADAGAALVVVLAGTADVDAAKGVEPDMGLTLPGLGLMRRLGDAQPESGAGQSSQHLAARR